MQMRQNTNLFRLRAHIVAFVDAVDVAVLEELALIRDIGFFLVVQACNLVVAFLRSSQIGPRNARRGFSEWRTIPPSNTQTLKNGSAGNSVNIFESHERNSV